MEPLFPKAILTLDVCHVVEKLWEVGPSLHKEGSAELKAWVEELKELVYAGRPDVGETVAERLLAGAEAWSGNQGPASRWRR